MKKAWQIWSLFFLCLFAVAVAMLWLSLTTVRSEAQRETDRAETELARRESELQELISSALYRMDLKMLPLVAQEAARPPNFYRSFYDIAPLPTAANTQRAPNGADTPAAQEQSSQIEKVRLASPLLFQTSDLVLLHFEIDAADKITSPQFPEDKERETAINSYQVQEQTLDDTLTMMDQARSLFDYSTLLKKTGTSSDSQVSNATAADSFFNQNYKVPAVENLYANIQAEIQKPQQASKGYSNGSKAVQQRARGAQRLNKDFDNRFNSTQRLTEMNSGNLKYQQWEQSIANGFGNDDPFQQQPLPSDIAPTFPMQPIWQGENLIMARRAFEGKRSVIQCCWLDWEKIKTELKKEAGELLPALQFEGITAETQLKIGTALTTIPVQIIVDRTKMLSTLAFDSSVTKIISTLPISLLTAWGCLALAAIASGLLLRGVMRLSERRAAFVSAVTHELRTPLTTFRMYSEMLAEGMVPTEKKQQYASTLKVQADRLSHLVENVLQFAKLERGPAKIVKEPVTICVLLDRCQSRMEERAAEGQMKLVVEAEKSVLETSLMTQPAAIEQILFNLVDNACKYANSAQDNRIVVSIEPSNDRMRFTVRDFGPGITPTDSKRIFEPFQQSASATENAVSGVGLGLALCNRMARSMGGSLTDDRCEKGACFVLELPQS